MPPSRHSSSHHSSSHHSSHSSSHHSSSSRSHSSHSSSHHGSSVLSSRSSYKRSTSVRRNRTSQPYGWNSAVHGTVRHFNCAAHDYDYYPQGWTASDGRSFEEGYYDETGQHYDNMVMVGGETMLKCDFCGNRMVYQWKEGTVPVCDKCGAQFQIDITDKEQKVYNSGGRIGTGFKEVFSRTPFAGKAAIVVFLICLLLPFFVIAASLFLTFSSRIGSAGTRYKTESVKNSVYVEEIGRTCYLDGEDWYDSQTKCWFYYNDDVSPDQWQYWYEGISSDYGDYGWMEYDMDEGAWYIETDDGNWVHLPGSYDTSALWHMTDEYVNAY
ncbi:MAG: hypothetical protein IKX95_08165 [Lachnospiraceae bacterium]|nr:hypothetical protein [Lachnospiraceae bacterium]